MAQATPVQELATRLSTTPAVVKGPRPGPEGGAERVTKVIRQTGEYLAANPVGQ
jgi:hypothetical protein